MRESNEPNILQDNHGTRLRKSGVGSRPRTAAGVRRIGIGIAVLPAAYIYIIISLALRIACEDILCFLTDVIRCCPTTLLNTPDSSSDGQRLVGSVRLGANQESITSAPTAEHIESAIVGTSGSLWRVASKAAPKRSSSCDTTRKEMQRPQLGR